MHFYNEKCELIAVGVVNARKKKLYPSVTTVTGIVNNYALNQWIIKQAVLASLTLPRVADENDESYVKRILKDSKEEGKVAADKGTDLHDVIENLLKKQPVEHPLADALALFIKNLGLKPIHIEKIFVNKEIETGCRIDVYGEIAGKKILIDWKTQSLKENGKFNVYDNWATQLAGNAMCMKGYEVDGYWNIIIAVDEANYGELYVHQWDLVDMAERMALFYHLRQAYKIINKL